MKSWKPVANLLYFSKCILQGIALIYRYNRTTIKIFKYGYWLQCPDTIYKACLTLSFNSHLQFDYTHLFPLKLKSPTTRYRNLPRVGKGKDFPLGEILPCSLISFHHCSFVPKLDSLPKSLGEHLGEKKRFFDPISRSLISLWWGLESCVDQKLPQVLLISKFEKNKALKYLACT